MTESCGKGLVSPSDIADLAGVSRGAVSNWRKRADDFPVPVGGTSGKPLFARDTVVAWLKGRGHSIKTDSGETTLWAAMNALRCELRLEHAVDLILGLTCIRKESAAEGHPYWKDLRSAPPDELPKRVVREVKDLTDSFADPPHFREIISVLRPGPLAALITAIDNLDVEILAHTVDFVLEKLAKSRGKVGAEHGFVGSRTSSLLSRIAAVRPAAVIYDPACGIGTALLGAIDYGARPERLVGHDINGDVLRIARQRAFLHGIDLELTETDVLRADPDPALRADTIIAEPPFGLRHDLSRLLTDPRFEFGAPPRTSADTAWIQHVTAHLTKDGRGYVLTPAGALFRGGNERLIRTELVRRGCIEAIVGLPGKMLPHTATPLVLWVLRRPTQEAGKDTILFVDASDSDDVEDRIVGWLANSRQRQDVPHVEVAASDVLANESVLMPQRWVSRKDRDPEEVARDFAHRWDGLGVVLQKIRNAPSNVQDFAEVRGARVYSIGELINQGVLEMRTGRPVDRYEGLPKKLRARIMTAGEVRDGTFHGNGLDGLDGIPDLTRAGDVLVTTMHTVRARVDERGGHLPSTGVHRLRILNPDVLTPHYLALMLSGNWNARFQVGSTIQRAAVRDLEIPLVPRDEQSKVELAIRSLDQLHEATAALERQIGDVRTTYLDAVYYNVPLKSSDMDPVGSTGEHRDADSEGAT